MEQGAGFHPVRREEARNWTREAKIDHVYIMQVTESNQICLYWIATSVLLLNKTNVRYYWRELNQTKPN